MEKELISTQYTDKRDSNIELLRIIAACGVIILHYNNKTMGGALAYVNNSTANEFFLDFLEACFICAVDLFMLISGCYGVKAKSSNIKKPVLLIAETVFFQMVSYVINIIFGESVLSLKTVIRCFLPVNYFVILYVCVFLLRPYINLVIMTLEKNGYLKKFICLVLLMFSAEPFLVDLINGIGNVNINGLSTISAYGSQYGYTIVNFILIYILGAYLRLNKQETRAGFFLLLLVMFETLLIFVSNKYDIKLHATDYHNPVVILLAVFTFLFFKNLKIKNSRIINSIAGASFTCYLIHTQFFRFLYIGGHVNRPLWMLILHIMAVCTSIYLISWFAFKIFDWIFRKTTEKIDFPTIYIGE